MSCSEVSSDVQRLGEDCHPHSQGLPFVSQWLVSTIDYASQLQALSLDLDSLPEHLGAPLPSSLRLKHLSIAVRVCDHGDISGETFARSARAAAWVRGCLEELKNSDTLESLSVSFPLMDMAASVPWPGSIHLENMSRLKHVAFDTYMPILGGLFLPAGCSLMWGARSSAASDRGSTFRIKHAQPSALQQPRLLTEHNWPYGTWPGPDSAYIITTDIDLGAAQAPVSLQGWSSMGTMAVTTTDSAHFLVPKTWSHNLSLKAESLSVAFEDVDAFVRGMKYFRFQGVTQQLIRFGANIRHACKAAGVKWFQHTETIQGVCRSGRSTKAYTKTWWNVTISSSQDVLHAEWEPISSLGLWPQDPVLEIQDGLIQSLKPNACYHLLHQ